MARLKRFLGYAVVGIALFAYVAEGYEILAGIGVLG
jgi:hypothetical protein